MKELMRKVFQFKDSPVHVIIDADGTPLVNGADVCRILEIKNPRDAYSRLRTEDRRAISATEQNRNLSVGSTDANTTRSHKRGSSATYVTESGLIDLMLESRKPQARELRHWVTAEVLPDIFRHGMYLTPQKRDEALDDPANIDRLVDAYVRERKRRKKLEARELVFGCITRPGEVSKKTGLLKDQPVHAYLRSNPRFSINVRLQGRLFDLLKDDDPDDDED